MPKYIYAIVSAIIIVTAAVALTIGGSQEIKENKQVVRVIAPDTTCRDNPEACVKYDAFGFATLAVEIHNRQVAEYLHAIEQERIAQEKIARQQSTQVSGQSFNLPSECEGKVIPAHIVMRESRCNYGSVNWGGCGGNNCYGMYQIDGRHWTSWGNTPGACSDLNWEVSAEQDECANRLSSGGTNLRPWSG